MSRRSHAFRVTKTEAGNPATHNPLPSTRNTKPATRNPEYLTKPPKSLIFKPNLLFHIPHHHILRSSGFELSALSFELQTKFAIGGETASTGTKKLWLHTEHFCQLVKTAGT